MRCPVCQSEGQGAYCAACGAPLEGAPCPGCQAPLVPGAQYCVACGRPVRAAASNLPWYIAGAALVALIAVVLTAVLRTGQPASAATGAPAASAPAGSATTAAPPLTGTPREQADRLFNRIMQASAAGDSAEVSFFLPMALAAYRDAEPLDADGLYHLSVLEKAAGDPTSARATAERILEADPDHLLGLAAAARAARDPGDTAAARRYYGRLLEVYDAQRQRALPEYADHTMILPLYQQEARDFLGR